MSSKSIPQKLQLKEGCKFLLVNPPSGHDVSLVKLPTDATLLSEVGSSADAIQVFISSQEELEQQLTKLKPVLSPKGILWATYPKGSSKVKTDINGYSIRKYASTVGFEAVAIFSVDRNWAALRLKKR